MNSVHLQPPYLQTWRKNILDSELDEGNDLYMKYGTQALKNRVALSPMNIFDRAAHYYKYCYKGSRLAGPDLVKVRGSLKLVPFVYAAYKLQTILPETAML